MDITNPVETHTTAAWSGTADIKPVSNVSIPSLEDVAEAKEYVDSNQK